MSMNEKLLIELRKKVIESDFNRMNDVQKEAVFTVKGAVLVLAGAGSGKTTVIVNRIANIIKYGNGYHSPVVPAFINQEDVAFLEAYLKEETHSEEDKTRAYSLCEVEKAAPWNIIAITFTNKAAGELKERLSAMLGEETGKAIWASTFHSACLRILRRDIERIGYSRNFTIYDTDDSIRVIKDCMKEQNVDEKHFTPKSILGSISRAKNNLQTPLAYQKQNDDDFRTKTVGEIYKAYQKKVEGANALDFDDIIMKTVGLLQEDKEVLAYYQNKFKYVMVDEYQDTNHSQYVLVSLLASGSHNICVVGDDDQSIYRFRGATIENILNFENEFKDTKVVRLEQNYRSTKSILDAANHVIEKNVERKSKKLWTQNEDGELITLYNSYDDQTEAMFIANTIFQKVKEEGMKFSDFSILYRINAQSGLLERIFSKMGLPHRIIGGVRFYDRKEVKDIMSYLSLIANTEDDLRLKRIINEPKRGIGGTTVDLVEALSTSLEKSMYEVVGLSMQIEPLQRASGKLYAFYTIIQDLIDKRDTMPLSEFIGCVIRESGYEKTLKDKNDTESLGRLENIMEIISNAVSYEKNMQEVGEAATLDGFLEEIALVAAIDNHDPDADAVSLMTVHSAKGLEFPIVFIYGMEESIFPSGMAMSEPEELAEERRLMYVAVTRAKKQLYMTHADSRVLYGKTISNQVSRFVKDIPQELLEKVRTKKPKPVFANVPVKKTTLHNQNSMFTTGRREAQIQDIMSANTVGKNYEIGDIVEHGTFGNGKIVTVKKMSGDTFLEIAFENVGTKKLMANFAKLTKK